MTIPQAWMDERNTLVQIRVDQQERAKMAAQLKKPLVLKPGETLVTDETFAALDAKPITSDEVTQLAGGRGEYHVGDTRGFVMQQEDACMRSNCWMVRTPSGKPEYWSEDPVVITKRNGALVHVSE